MLRFEEGKRYQGRFISNYDSIVTIEVTKRTPKMVTYRALETGQVKKRKAWQSCAGEFEHLQHCDGCLISARRQVQ